MGGSSLVAGPNGQNSQRIEIIKLDDFLGHEAKISFIKIDVEGYEYFVLKGLKYILKKHHPKLLLEYSPMFYRQFNLDHAYLIYHFISSFGYTIMDMENLDKPVDINYIEKLLNDNVLQTNFLAI